MSSTHRSPRSLFGLALGCATLLAAAMPVSASPDAPDAPPIVATEGEAQIDWLRRVDRQIERWHLQVTIPDAGRPSDADLSSLADRLHRLASRGDQPKAEVLLRRVDDLRHLLTADRVVKRHGLAPAAAPKSWVVPNDSRPGCAAAMTIDAGEWIVDPASTVGEGLWLRFTAPEDGTYVAHTVGSRADTRLERWTACDASQYAAMDDDGVGLRSRLVFAAKAGEVVRLRVRSTADDRVLVAIEKGAGGTMSGRVTIASTGEPVADRGVTIYRALGGGSSFETSTLTAVDGTWSVAGLADGPYFAVVDASFNSNLFGQIYDGVDCPQSVYCPGQGGTPIVLEGSVENIDFALHYGAIVSGRVVEAGSGIAIPGATVSARDLLGSQSVFDVTDAAGRYRITGLLDDEVRVTATSSGHRDERWPDVPCEGSSCATTDGTAVTVAVDTEVSDIDFDLLRLSSIAGQITATSDGAPVSSADIQIFLPDGTFVTSTTTDGRGAYLVGGLDAGSYHLKVLNSWNLVPRFWPDADCVPPACTGILGDPIDVGVGQAVTGIDIAASTYPSISGRVIDGVSGEPVDEGSVTLYDATGQWLDNDFLFRGDYSIDHVRPGTVYALYSASGYVDELYDDVPCDGCDPTTGSPIDAMPDGDISGIDFEVQPLGKISGRVTLDGSGDPVPGVRLRVYDVAGGLLGGGHYSDENGEYTITRLEAGRYFVQTDSELVIDELFDSVPCEEGCDPTTGTGIDVTIAGEVTGIDFVVGAAPRVRGHVTDIGSGEALAGGRARLFDDSGQFVGSSSISSIQGFELTGLIPGTYHLLIEGPPGYLSEVVGDGPCVEVLGDCDPTVGTPLVLAVGDDRVVDVAVTLGGSIEGTVSDRVGAPVGNGRVHVYDDAGRQIADDFVSRDGTWRVDALPAGDVTALFDGTTHVGAWWMDVPLADACPQAPCDPSVGTPITVGLGATVSDIDFVVDALGMITGQLIDDVTGEPIHGGRVELYNALGNLVGSDAPDLYGEFSFYWLEPGTYTLGVNYLDGYLEQIHGGDACDPACDPTSGTPVVAALSSTTEVIVPVTAGPGVYGRVLDAATGRPLVGVGLDVWDDSGEYVTTTSTDTLGRYRLLLGSGSFRLSTDTGSDHGDIVWPDVPCPDGSAFAGLCDPMAGTVIDLPDHMPLTAIDLHLDGPPSAGLLFFGDFEDGGFSGWTVP